MMSIPRKTYVLLYHACNGLPSLFSSLSSSLPFLFKFFSLSSLLALDFRVKLITVAVVIFESWMWIFKCVFTWLHFDLKDFTTQETSAKTWEIMVVNCFNEIFNRWNPRCCVYSAIIRQILDLTSEVRRGRKRARGCVEENCEWVCCGGGRCTTEMAKTAGSSLAENFKTI